MTLNKISKAFFINLDRRKDRLEHINKSLPFLAERFPAVDAKNLELDEEIEKIFKKCLNKLTKPEIACSLSHYKLWKQLTLDKEANNYLILEDDVVFKKGFTNFWNQVFSEHIPSNYNLIYLGGCQPWNKPEYPKALKRHNDFFCNIKKNDFFTKDDHYFHMNAQSYIISKNGAKLICDYIEMHGLDLEKNQAQDIFMIKFFNKNKLFSAPESIYHLNPLMSYQLHEENGNTEIDKNSDIRFAKEAFSETQKKGIRAEDLFVPKRTNLTKFRCGKDEDGGYVLLKEIFNKIDTVYSYGIDDAEDSDSFDVECTNSGKKVYMYDGTINRQQSSNPSMVFKKENLTNENFKLHIQENGDGGRVGMLLKMDIEGCEYPVIESNLDLIDKHFEMLCIEFHGLNNPEYYNFENKLEVIELLLQKYDIFHMHANNWVARKFEVPNVMEISFIRKGVCLNESDCSYPIKGLDFPNCQERDDYILDWWVKKGVSFPALREISNKEIPKKIHLSWKNKDILNSNYELIRKGAKNLELLNPDWDVQVYDDEDVNRLLRDSIGRDNWGLIKDKKITEKTDLWRLIKTYKEGGMYVDIDRYIDTPISEIVNPTTSMVLPTFRDIDFSQDFILTCAKNPIIGKAIVNNLKYRKQEKPLFFTAVYSYMESVSDVLGDKIVDRRDNPDYFNKIRSNISKCSYLETYRETGPGDHALFRNRNNNFNIEDFNKDKADFYNSENVAHWNADTRNEFKTIELNQESASKLNQKQKEFIKLKDKWADFVDMESFKFIESQIPYSTLNKKDFDCFNPGCKIAIVSLYTDEIASFGMYSEKSIKNYCIKQNYTFYVYRKKLDGNASPNWSKAQAILNHIKDHDYIVWMDSDTLIFNPEKKLESIIEKAPKKFILATKDIGDNCMLNSGVLFLKSHQYTKNLITKWRDFNGDKSSLYASGGDQEILCEILRKSDGYGFNRKIFEMNEFNTDPRLVNEDTFILHFMAYPYELKKIFMSYWCS